MRFPRIFTPSESRLAALLFILAVLGSVTRWGRGLSPEIEAWLTGPDPVDPHETRDTVFIGAPRAVGVDTPPVPTASSSRHPLPEPPQDRLLIDPNRADAATLGRLPGVGPVLAHRILEDRARNGAYQAPEDLLRVKGIGNAILERIRPFLKLP